MSFAEWNGKGSKKTISARCTLSLMILNNNYGWKVEELYDNRAKNN